MPSFCSGQPLQLSPEAIGWRLWSAVGSAAPHRFSHCSASRALANHLALNAPEMTAVEKRRRRFALPAQSKMRLATHNDAIARVIYSRLNYRQNAESAGDK